MEKFLSEGVDLKTISRISSAAGDAHYFDDSTTPGKVREYLDSIRELDTLKGMKWLLAMMSKGRDVSDFFPNVVKNVVAKSVEVKKMVYQYLVHYADFDDSCREMALLSVNSFQKDLAGSNQLIRGLALRVMSSMRVSEITQIQLLAVQRCATDTSPYVRKCAAIALTKLASMGNDEQTNELLELLKKLLQDNSVMVLGSAVVAYNEICPNDYGLIHGCFRKLCQLLADLDEWTQVSVLEVLTRYCRTQFTDPAPGMEAAVRLQAKQRSKSAAAGSIGKTVKRRIVKRAFYSDEEDESDEEEMEVGFEEGDDEEEPGKIFGKDAEVDIDHDHRLLLRSSLPLLKSRNASVVVGVVTLHYYCGSQSSGINQQMGKALVRILRNHREAQYVILTCINTLAQERPAIFRGYIADFYIQGSDPVFNRLLKLEILTAICTPEKSQAILRELQTYVKHGNTTFVAAVVRAVGRIVDADPESAEDCMGGLMHLLACSNSQKVVGETVVVLRQLLQQNQGLAMSERLLQQLAKMLIMDDEGIEEPSARASIVWLISEFHEVFVEAAGDILRVLAKGFKDETTEAKQQILNFAIKLSLRKPDDEPAQSLMQYILELARYDVDTDLRDRSRFVTALMGLAPSTEGEEEQEFDADALEQLNQHAKGIMLAPKLPPVTLLGGIDVDGRHHFNLGSMSSLMGHRSLGYENIPNWAEVPSAAELREAGKPSSYFEGSLGTEGRDFNLSEEDSDASDASTASSEDSGDSDSDSEEDSVNAVSSEEDSESSSESDESESSEDLKPMPRKTRVVPRPMKKLATSKRVESVVAGAPLIDYTDNSSSRTQPLATTTTASDVGILLGKNGGGAATQPPAAPEIDDLLGDYGGGSAPAVAPAVGDAFSAFDLLDGSPPTETTSGAAPSGSLADELLSLSSPTSPRDGGSAPAVGMPKK